MNESDTNTTDFNQILVLERKLQREQDFEKFDALGEVSRYLRKCTNHLVINTLFLKLAQLFKDLPDLLKVELKQVVSCLLDPERVRWQVRLQHEHQRVPQHLRPIA